jgi:pyruvate formate lyase activating enzyme
MVDAHEAMYYEKLDGDHVHCRLCPHECRMAPGRRGVCRQRANDGGTLVSRIYGRVTSASMDPIEKKPLYHFHPGRPILSLGTNGCNLSCKNCQNWSISQEDGRTQVLPPADAVAIARREGSFAIAYTYNEPFIWYEYVLDTSRRAHDAGLKNVLVTNGFVNPEPLAELLPFVDALNIDIKSIRDDFYREVCGAWLGPVQATAKAARQRAHVEITNLVIPNHTDSDEDLIALADWIRDELGDDTPVHLSAYSPRYRLNAPPTPRETLLRAHGIFAERLRFVYVGNMMLDCGANTACPSCGSAVIRRSGYRTEVVGLGENGSCAGCGETLNLVA